MKNPSDLRSANEADLLKQLDDLYHGLFNLRFQRVAGQTPNTSRLKEVRRDIARIKTIMRERELAGARARGGA